MKQNDPIMEIKAETSQITNDRPTLIGNNGIEKRWENYRINSSIDDWWSQKNSTPYYRIDHIARGTDKAYFLSSCRHFTLNEFLKIVG